MREPKARQAERGDSAGGPGATERARADGRTRAGADRDPSAQAGGTSGGPPGSPTTAINAKKTPKRPNRKGGDPRGTGRTARHTPDPEQAGETDTNTGENPQPPVSQPVTRHTTHSPPNEAPITTYRKIPEPTPKSNTRHANKNPIPPPTDKHRRQPTQPSSRKALGTHAPKSRDKRRHHGRPESPDQKMDERDETTMRADATGGRGGAAGGPGGGGGGAEHATPIRTPPAGARNPPPPPRILIVRLMTNAD